jgi:hypothetical protein
VSTQEKAIAFRVNAEDVTPGGGQAVKMAIQLSPTRWVETWFEPSEAEDFAQHMMIAARTARAVTAARSMPIIREDSHGPNVG